MHLNTPPHVPDSLLLYDLDDENDVEEEEIAEGSNDIYDEDAVNEVYSPDDEMFEVMRVEEFGGEANEVEIVTDEEPSNDDGDDLAEVLDEEDEESDAEQNYPITDDALVTFAKHTAPVFGCAVNPNRDWAATGGEDDRAFVWERSNGRVIHEITDHKDTVTAVDFNHDGTYLATGDMAGEIMVHAVVDNGPSSSSGISKPILHKVWEYSMGDMLWMRFHPAANVLMAGAESGEVYVWRIPGGDTKILPGQGNRCEASQLTSDGRKLLTGYGSGMVRLWDIKSTNVLMEVTQTHQMGHDNAVTAVACDPTSPMYLSGSQSDTTTGFGRIVLSNNSGPVGVMNAEGSVETLAFSPLADSKLAVSGTLTGHLAVWDLTRLVARNESLQTDPRDGIIKLEWLNERTILSGTLQGRMQAYDVRTLEKIFSFSGHRWDIYDFRYIPSENLVLTVSEDSTAKIFQVPPLAQ